MAVNKSDINRVLLYITGTLIIVWLLLGGLKPFWKHYKLDKDLSEFEWKVSVYAQTPMQLISGIGNTSIIKDNKGYNLDKKALLANNEIYLEWFSYSDNQFYEINLPTAETGLKQELKKLYEEEKNKELSIPSSIPLRVYFEIKEDGIVSVWIDSGKGPWLAYTAKGEKIAKDWSQFASNIEYPRDKWVDMVNRKYNWGVLSVSGSSELTIISYSADVYNSAKLHNDSLAGITPKYFPQKIRIVWTKGTKNDLKRYAYIKFDENDIIKKLSELYPSGEYTQPSSFKITIHSRYSIDISLIREKKEIKITAFELE